MKPCIFIISFSTAHFRRHETKKFRSTYFLPPPTVIWGIIGAAFGIKREKLIEFVKENNITVGAELINFKGTATEKAKLLEYKNKNFINTVEDFEFLIEPYFRIGVFGKEGMIEELKERIDKRRFEFDIYGGITDCFLKDIRNGNSSKLVKKTSAKGMIPIDLVEGCSHLKEGGKVVKVLYFNTFFYQGFNVEFKLKKPIKTVDGIAIWDIDDVEQFRKGNLE